MNGYKEFTGKTLDEAIKEACAFFNVERAKLEIEIVNDAKTGIFGLVGAKKATLRARRVNLDGMGLTFPGKDEARRERGGKKPGRQREEAGASAPDAGREKAADAAETGEAAAAASRPDKRRPPQDMKKQPPAGSLASRRAADPAFSAEEALGTDVALRQENLPAQAAPPAASPVASPVASPAAPGAAAPGQEQRSRAKGRGRGKNRERAEAAGRVERTGRAEASELTEPAGSAEPAGPAERAERAEPAETGSRGRGSRRGKKKPPPKNGRETQDGREGKNGRGAGDARQSAAPEPEAEAALPFPDDESGFEDQLPAVAPEELDQDLLRRTVLEAVRVLVRPLAERVESDLRVEDGRVLVRLETEENQGLLIGRDGQTVAALQYLLGCIVSRKLGAAVRLQLDAGDYREKQEEKLRNLALSLARKVKSTQRPQSTRPLSAYHRRIIHLALQDDPEVQTHSKSEGNLKSVVIVPRRKGAGK